MSAPHPDFQQFYDALVTGTLFTPWQGRVYRQTAPRWVSRPYRLTGVGALLGGGRWNVQRLVPAVYASTDPDTMHEEAFATAKRYGWDPATLRLPQTIIQMDWKFQAVLDLTDNATLTTLGISRKALTDCDWFAEQQAGCEPLTQAIARAAFEREAEGLIAPSARKPGGINVVYFPAHRRAGSNIVTLNEPDIPLLHGL